MIQPSIISNQIRTIHLGKQRKFIVDVLNNSN